MQSTGVYLEEGDYYSLFGKGEIQLWPSNPTYIAKPGLRTIGTIGRGFYFRLRSYSFSGELIPDATNQEQHPVKKGAVEGQLILSIIE
jgi:hypothetical protein